MGRLALRKACYSINLSTDGRYHSKQVDHTELYHLMARSLAAETVLLMQETDKIHIIAFYSFMTVVYGSALLIPKR